ncbi:MAG: hypothetical protein J3Q66DRAFT_384668 [Benniella sp.]|nr:MAG: hypothetical protein J3Q66DRAFT_384668 [Benniella sp.]
MDVSDNPPKIPQQLTHVSGKWSTVARGSFDKQLGGERGMTDEPESLCWDIDGQNIGLVLVPPPPIKHRFIPTLVFKIDLNLFNKRYSKAHSLASIFFFARLPPVRSSLLLSSIPSSKYNTCAGMESNHSQPGHAYRLPMTNIAYHIHDDLDRAQTISRQAFQRTLSSYHEHEELADLFQIELDKRERETQERKGLEKSVKTQKHKSSKRIHQGRALDRTQPPPPPERQSLRRHLRSTGTTHISGLGTPEGGKDTLSVDSAEKGVGNLKRSRRNSDISNSDNSGYGDDDMRLLLPTPSPRLTPSESRNENQGSNDSGSDPSNRSSDQLAPSHISGASQASTSSTASPSQWGHTTTGRRKRKQVVPVHPSIVERMPGITLRIQRELQGDLLQIEILKNLEDYRGHQGDKSSSSEIQGAQDLKKIKESIDSGRHGIMSHPVDAAAGLRSQSLSSSLASLTWTSSNGGSAESLTTMGDAIDDRSLPLTWENFSTRDCVVNKVIGKYDEELDILEGVVQDAVARKQQTQYALQQQQEREREESPIPNQSPRKSLGTSAGSGAASTVVAASPNLRATRASGAVSSNISSRFVPARATRSRRSTSDKHENGLEAEGDLVTQQDTEYALKQRRKKRMEERDLEGSKDDEGGDDGDGATAQVSSESAISPWREIWRFRGSRSGFEATKCNRNWGNDACRGFQEKENTIGFKVLGRTCPETSPWIQNIRYSSSNWIFREDLCSVKFTSEDKYASDGTRRNKKLWSRGRNTRKEDEVVDTTSDATSDSDAHDTDDNRRMPLVKHIQSTRSIPLTVNEQLIVRNTPQGTSGSSRENSGSYDSGGRTRARARSFSNTIVTTDKVNFFESALDVIDQKRRESIAKKKAAKAETEERERQEREQREQREKEAKERQETLFRLQEQAKAQKIEASNLPKSSKSLPGRVLRRSRTDGSTDEGSVDPDCTSCRLELSTDDRALWKAACEQGEIWLPKTWGTHAILCTTCRQQYLDHHSRCTACFYVPVKEEMVTSGASCSRCKAGTWLTEAVRVPGSVAPLS